MLATMRLSPLLSLPALLPTAFHVHVHACRSTPLLTHLDALRPQSFPALALSNFPSSARFASIGTSPQQQQQHQPQNRPVMNPGGDKEPGTFSYKIAASFSAKGRKFDPKTDIYTFPSSSSSSSLAGSEEEAAAAVAEEIFTGRPAAGQDAFFISAFGSSEADSTKKKQQRVAQDVAFGVADGVGGWADSGIDSADFSHGLCRAMAVVAGEGGKEGEGKRMGPRELLDTAYRRVVEGGEVKGGGSTACVAVGGRDGVVRVANLGDSGFLQLRPSAVHYSSNPQTHAFNTPFQLSIVPPRVLQMSKMFGGGPLSDLPSEADVSSHEVSHGDVLVFATDGVWDNLPAKEVLGAVSRLMKIRHAWVDKEGRLDVGKRLKRETESEFSQAGKWTVQTAIQAEIAASIVQEAKAASLNKLRDGPFAREVQKHYPGENWHGGKVDDICIVVAVVVDEAHKKDPVGKPKL